MSKQHKTFLAKARSWASRNNLKGSTAFSRFVMLVFVERINQGSAEFVFKGGNLLWLYIKTPRVTVDLDFITENLGDHDEVRKALDTACQSSDRAIVFSVAEFQKIEKETGRGAGVKIRYQTEDGQMNMFDMDIVYAVSTSKIQIPSPLQSQELIQVATMENIVADKLDASYTFGSGNTRMKDYDDLWRISQVSPTSLNWSHLKKLLSDKSIPPNLDAEWITPRMTKLWKVHVSRYGDLPKELEDLFMVVNNWLQSAR